MKTEVANKSKKFPFWEVIVRTLIYAFDNKKLFYRSAIFWSILILDELICGFPLFGGGDNTFSSFLSVIICLAAVSSISVFVFRYIILGENRIGININFGKREFRYFTYFATMIMIMFLPIFIFLMSVYYIYQNNPQDVFEAFFMLIILFFFYVGYARINLVFPSIAVDKGVDIKKAFILTMGNSLRIFFALCFLAFIIWLMFCTSLKAVDFFVAQEFIKNLLQTVIFTFFIYLYAFIYAVLFAHIYQNLHYHKKNKGF